MFNDYEKDTFIIYYFLYLDFALLFNVLLMVTENKSELKSGW